jgi:ribonuclease R
VIRSKARLDYPGVAAALSGDFRGRRERYRKWADALEDLDVLARMLRRRRRARGMLELEIPEPKVVLDADDPRLVRDVVRSKGDEGVKRAYELVEEYMIAANEAVGSFFVERDLDTVWRVHAPPKLERIEELAENLAAFDVKVDIEAATKPQGMQRVLEQLVDKPASRALTFLVLRSLKQAVYDTENLGHFGLASQRYVHFTSPIRRYPDLLVHRLMKHYLHSEGQASGGGGSWYPPKRQQLQDLAASSSRHERRAIEAEREAVAMYRAYLMRDQIGDSFAGTVSGVASFGVFVELEEPFIEGLIKLDTLGDDYFDYDALKMQISGRRTGFTLGIGAELKVEVLDVSVVRRRVEFRLLDAPGHRALAEATGEDGERGRGARRHATTKARSKATRKSEHASRGKPSKGRGRGKDKAKDSKSKDSKSKTSGGKSKGKGKGKGAITFSAKSKMKSKGRKTRKKR